MWIAESQKQYWTVKKMYRDTIIFFKVGKFYELYEVRVFKHPTTKLLFLYCLILEHITAMHAF